MSYQPLSFFGPDEHSYNCGSSMEGDDADDSGRPGIGLVASAIQFWALQNSGKSCTIGRAAAVFNMPAEAVAEAIDHHRIAREASAFMPGRDRAARAACQVVAFRIIIQ